MGGKGGRDRRREREKARERLMAQPGTRPLPKCDRAVASAMFPQAQPPSWFQTCYTCVCSTYIPQYMHEVLRHKHPCAFISMYQQFRFGTAYQSGFCIKNHVNYDWLSVSNVLLLWSYVRDTNFHLFEKKNIHTSRSRMYAERFRGVRPFHFQPVQPFDVCIYRHNGIFCHIGCWLIKNRNLPGYSLGYRSHLRHFHGGYFTVGWLNFFSPSIFFHIIQKLSTYLLCQFRHLFCIFGDAFFRMKTESFSHFYDTLLLSWRCFFCLAIFYSVRPIILFSQGK